MFFKAKFELSPYGEEFKNSYIVLKLLDKNQILKFNREVYRISKELDSNDVGETLESSEKVVELMYKEVAQAFVSGEIFDEATETERPMQKKDIENFPPAIVREINQFIQGSLPKKV